LKKEKIYGYDYDTKQEQYISNESESKFIKTIYDLFGTYNLVYTEIDNYVFSIADIAKKSKYFFWKIRTFLQNKNGSGEKSTVVSYLFVYKLYKFSEARCASCQNLGKTSGK